MQFSEADLRAAVSAGALDTGQHARLLGFLQARAAARGADASVPLPRFDLAHVLWYAGALIVIGAMGLFSTLAFSQMGGEALTVTAVVYAVAFLWAGHHLWHARNLKTPGGLLIAVAVSMAPLAVYGFMDAYIWEPGAEPGSYQSFYEYIKGSWVYLDAAAIVAAAIALRFYPFPFLVAIIAVALWFMSMDLVPWVFKTTDYDFTWDMRRTVSIWFGLGVLIVAWIVDRKPRGGDFAFWLHLFGLLAFWGGLSSKSSDSELAKAVYCLLNVGLIVLSVVLVRRAYAVFGAMGVAFYLGDLSPRVFKDSLLFPFALSLIGVAIIGLGLLYFRKRDAIRAWVEASLPDAIKNLRPAHARIGE